MKLEIEIRFGEPRWEIQTFESQERPGGHRPMIMNWHSSLCHKRKAIRWAKRIQGFNEKTRVINTETGRVAYQR